jgi:hypothetical protein
MRFLYLIIIATIAMTCSSCAIESQSEVSLQKLKSTGHQDDSASKKRYLVEEVAISKNRSPSLAVESDRAKLVAVEKDGASGKNKVIWLKYDQFTLPAGLLERGKIVEISHSKHGDPVGIKFLKPDRDNPDP